MSSVSLRTLALVGAVAAALCASSAFAAGRVDTGALQTGAQFDGFIVGYRANSVSKRDTAQIQRNLDQVASTAFGRAKSVRLSHARTLGTGAELVNIDRKLDRVDAETLMRQIASNPDVEYVEPNIRLYPALTPNDQFYNLQYGYQNGIGGSNANLAWDLGFLGLGKIVAVIDTGYRPHADLGANIINGYDFITDPFVGNDGNGRDSSALDPGDWTTTNQCFSGSPAQNSSWHGTHVAGTVAALTNNATGVAGMAYRSRVLAVRALGRCGGTLADIADAVIWSSGGSVAGVPLVGANRATVINMSLGGGSPTCSATMQNAINGAVGRGTTVVVAAGNSNTLASNFTPANCANVIVVGATDSAGARASFSNYGPLVDVSAPGVQIASTLNSGTTSPTTDAYAYKSGTSMAAPHVAGLVAMMQSKPSADCTPAQCESIIKANFKPFGAAPPVPMGTGIIDARRTILATP